MSSTSTPIPAHRFVEAIKELPLANLHFKAAEIRNSIAHLVSSNQQLQPFADEGDSDCREAIEENGEVIKSMEERISLLKREVETRGFKWGEDEPNIGDVGINGSDDGRVEFGPASGSRDTLQETRPIGGSLGDEELARRLREQMGEDHNMDDDDDDGLHL